MTLAEIFTGCILTAVPRSTQLSASMGR